MSKTVELVITRTINAPRGLVFEAFTQKEHLKHWWGPAGWEMEVIKLDLRPGGICHYCLQAVGNVMSAEEELETFKSILDSMQQGFGAAFEQLDQYLAAKG